MINKEYDDSINQEISAKLVEMNSELDEITASANLYDFSDYALISSNNDFSGNNTIMYEDSQESLSGLINSLSTRISNLESLLLGLNNN